MKRQAENEKLGSKLLAEFLYERSPRLTKEDVERIERKVMADMGKPYFSTPREVKKPTETEEEYQRRLYWSKFYFRSATPTTTPSEADKN